MQNDFTIAVLISGRGSNLKSLIDNARRYRIKMVLSSNPEAPGLEHARAAGIPALALRRSDYPSLLQFKHAVMLEVLKQKPSLVVLAGFMQVIAAEFIDAFPSRIVNIHPALLPAHPGLDTHKRVIEAKERIHGCTVHLVDYGVDSGPVIAQAAVEVLPQDDEPALAARVLTFEHRLYPWVINSIAAGEISLRADKIRYSRSCIREAAALGFLLPEAAK